VIIEKKLEFSVQSIFPFTFRGKRPTPPQIIQQELLMAAEEREESLILLISE
jgi:hypothetical protein